MSDRQEPLACEECNHPLAKQLFPTEWGWLCQRCWDEYEDPDEEEYWGDDDER